MCVHTGTILPTAIALREYIELTRERPVPPDAELFTDNAMLVVLVLLAVLSLMPTGENECCLRFQLIFLSECYYSATYAAMHTRYLGSLPLAHNTQHILVTLLVVRSCVGSCYVINRR